MDHDRWFSAGSRADVHEARRGPLSARALVAAFGVAFVVVAALVALVGHLAH